MSSKATIPCTVNRAFSAPAEQVYDAWLDPAIAGRWLFATPDGEIQRVEIDARVSGGFTIVERRATGDAEHVGTFVELQRPQRIAFTFTAQRGETPGDLIEVDIAPDGAGSALTLTHHMRPEWAAYVEQTAGGWLNLLNQLDQVLSAEV